MRILIVCSYRDFRPDGINQFIKEQVKAVSAYGCECKYYLVREKGILGYLKEIPLLRKCIGDFNPDIIHAHYGLCGLLANMATRSLPVVTTYHGSDIIKLRPRKFSNIAIHLSAWNIFVSQATMDMVHGLERMNCSLIPCGVDLTDDQLQTRTDARKTLGWNNTEKKVLFAGMYADDVKGPDLAKSVIRDLQSKLGTYVELIELKGYTRQEVNQLMCAVNCLLMTSKTEGSPQVIKEAMACGCPIVSVDVGDVAERVAGVAGCLVVKNRDPKRIGDAIASVFAYEGKTKGRERILEDGLDNMQIAKRIMDIYNRVQK